MPSSGTRRSCCDRSCSSCFAFSSNAMRASTMNSFPRCLVSCTHETEPRWVELIVAQQDTDDEGRFLVFSGHFGCQVEPLDELDSSYMLENWEIGLLSGVFF